LNARLHLEIKFYLRNALRFILDAVAPEKKKKSDKNGWRQKMLSG